MKWQFSTQQHITNEHVLKEHEEYWQKKGHVTKRVETYEGWISLYHKRKDLTDF